MNEVQSRALVVAVSLSKKHTVRKTNQSHINLIQGFGVEGDAHAGVKVRHRYLARKDPDRPNLRQAHLISIEIYQELRSQGFSLEPGDMGENITTRGIDLMDLPEHTRLHIGEEVILLVTGMREPCHLLDQVQDGLMKATLSREPHGQLIRKAGIMCIIEKGGVIIPGDMIRTELPKAPYRAMRTV